MAVETKVKDKVQDWGVEKFRRNDNKAKIRADKKLGDFGIKKIIDPC